MHVVSGPRVGEVKIQDILGSDHSGERAESTLSVTIEDEASEEIVQALMAVLVTRNDPASYERYFRERGRFLFGTSGQIDDGIFKALLYAETEGGRPETGYSVVRTASWAGKCRDGIYEAKDLLEIVEGNAFLDMTRQTPSKLSYPGIPVNRHTVVQPFNNASGETYIFGHRQDLTAVKGLNVPDDLKFRLVREVLDYHS